ncbi:hypothetical protein AGOR_G00232670 [Albula goreensis]|uniref:Cilia- and flagella-associated protein 97 n=1 Tax=Albula goreensis TaxID=1534307 RepID=A0A8T3CEW9_9TELE|nr:hypothetical protein AGOR_G00232670 [Albula goreensis]
MYSPKELEGEVDHSFFDSDCDDHGKERGDNSNVIGGNADVPGPVEHTVSGEGDSSQSKEVKGNALASDGHSSRPSSTSSLLSFEEQSDADGSSEKDPGNQFQIKAKIHTDHMTEEIGKGSDGDDEDGYKRSEEESEEDPDEKPKCKVAHYGLPKKSSGKFRSGKHSPTSSSKSDSSYSSPEDDSSASESSPQRKPPCSPPLRNKLGVFGRRERLRLPPEESEDTVTDVTPLSTPDVSPVQSFELSFGKEGERERMIVKQENILSGFGIGPTKDGSFSQAFMKMEKKLERELVMGSPTRRTRKNFSFSNDEVSRIDRENQRLLRELTRRTPRPKSSSVPKKPSSPPIRLSHSAINRQREQQRIERENLAFLKRLESAKPTPGMRRTEQLSDYQRQAGYLGTTSPTNPERSPSSRGSTGKSSRVSSASSLHRARPTSSVSTAVSKASRTAWP